MTACIPSAHRSAVAPTSKNRSYTSIDCVLFDLDGVVYRGRNAVAGAVEGISFLHRTGIPVNYVTNNATRAPETVAAHITELGIPARVEEVTTSAQVTGAALADHYGAGAAVLMIGTTGLSAALESAGLRTVTDLESEPVALVQGLDPDISYRTIAWACEILGSGIDWWATNPDFSTPGPGCELPGNGAFVEMLARLTSREPTVVGKPAPTMMRHAAQRQNAARPLMVGDRLDTDIAGGRNSGFDTALVLTGVHDLHDALAAPPGLRPRFILPSLRGLEDLIGTRAAESWDTTSALTPGNPGTDTGTHAPSPPRIVDGALHLDAVAKTTAAGIEAALRLAWEAIDRGETLTPGNLPRRIHD